MVIDSLILSVLISVVLGFFTGWKVILSIWLSAVGMILSGVFIGIGIKLLDLIIKYA